MEAATNVGVSASVPFLVVEVGPNVGASTSLGLGQTTRITPGISVWHVSAPLASGVPPGPHETDITPAGTAGPFQGLRPKYTHLT